MTAHRGPITGDERPDRSMFYLVGFLIAAALAVTAADHWLGLSPRACGALVMGFLTGYSACVMLHGPFDRR